MERPLCFVLMPFGKKPGSGGALIDFDAVYTDLIKPAVESARLVPVRADEEQMGGIIHKQMFERLILCEYAVADLTTANANVFYELGIRHAVKPATTVVMFAADGPRLPFDVALLRAMSYALGPDGRPDETNENRATLTKLLDAAQADSVDSPVYQLIEGFPDVQHIKTDVFRERVAYSSQIKEELHLARTKTVDAVHLIERRLGPLERAESGVLVDLMLSYRSLSAWSEVIRVVDGFPEPLRRAPLVQEQLAFALNRSGRDQEAERILSQLIESRGPSSETYGLLGRVYKDRWEAALDQQDETLARGLLDLAIDAYVKGFETDWRDAYPGVNAVTLMTLRTPIDPRAEQLIPIVRYAVERRIDSGKPDYWDYATLLELGVLEMDEDRSIEALTRALPLIRAPWEPDTTARNLSLIRKRRLARGENPAWEDKIRAALERSRGHP